MERHPDFKVDAYRRRTDSHTVVTIIHVPTGFSTTQAAWVSDHAHTDAWKSMASFLAERYREDHVPQSPPASFP